MDLEPLQDRILVCADCNEEFVFTVGAQEYFLEKGFTEEPKRCKSCYTQLKKEKRQQKKVVTRRTPNGNGRVPVAISRNGNVRTK